METWRVVVRVSHSDHPKHRVYDDQRRLDLLDHINQGRERLKRCSSTVNVNRFIARRAKVREVLPNLISLLFQRKVDHRPAARCPSKEFIRSRNRESQAPGECRFARLGLSKQGDAPGGKQCIKEPRDSLFGLTHQLPQGCEAEAPTGYAIASKLGDVGGRKRWRCILKSL